MTVLRKYVYSCNIVQDILIPGFLNYLLYTHQNCDKGSSFRIHRHSIGINYSISKHQVIVNYTILLILIPPSKPAYLPNNSRTSGLGLY